MREERKLPVSESNLKKTAVRLLGQGLVTPEVQYIQRVLGASATQQQLDDTVLAVRKLPWAKLMRATFIPALTRLVSTLTGREAGPIVHTIFVAIKDLRSTTVPRRVGASSIPLMNFYASSHRSSTLHFRWSETDLVVQFSGSPGI